MEARGGFPLYCFALHFLYDAPTSLNNPSLCPCAASNGSHAINTPRYWWAFTVSWPWNLARVKVMYNFEDFSCRAVNVYLWCMWSIGHTSGTCCVDFNLVINAQLVANEKRRLFTTFKTYRESGLLKSAVARNPYVVHIQQFDLAVSKTFGRIE